MNGPKMKFANHEKFFEAAGDCFIAPMLFGESYAEVTVEEFYQHIKARLTAEGAIGGPVDDLSPPNTEGLQAMISIDEHNAKRQAAHAAVAERRTGIACPQCHGELLYSTDPSGAQIVLASHPPRRAVGCEKTARVCERIALAGFAAQEAELQQRFRNVILYGTSHPEALRP